MTGNTMAPAPPNQVSETECRNQNKYYNDNPHLQIFSKLRHMKLLGIIESFRRIIWSTNFFLIYL